MDKAPSDSVAGRLRRDLGVIESYAALLGILIGAGIFTVTSTVGALTGPSVIIGYVVLFLVILATSVPYAAFLSTPLGQEPGGEYTHISRTLGERRLAFVGAWLKIISYIGAEAFLANSLANYLIAASGGRLEPETSRLPLALASLLFFFLVHIMGVRWFGRLQVTMCALLGVSLLALMAEVAAVYLPAGAAWFVTFGAIMAITTSMNSTMIVPSRLAFILSRDGLAPSWIGAIHPRTATPVLGLTLTFAASALLLIGQQISLTLNVAILALVILYFLHSLTFILLPRRNPSLAASIDVNVPPSLQRAAAWLSSLSMGALIASQVWQDIQTMRSRNLWDRVRDQNLTSVELAVLWGLIGLALYAYARRGKKNEGQRDREIEE